MNIQVCIGVYKDQYTPYICICLLVYLLTKCKRKPKGQSGIDNPLKLANWSHDTRRRQAKPKTQPNICLTPLYVNKHK